MEGGVDVLKETDNFMMVGLGSLLGQCVKADCVRKQGKRSLYSLSLSLERFNSLSVQPVDGSLSSLDGSVGGWVFGCSIRKISDSPVTGQPTRW